MEITSQRLVIAQFIPAKTVADVPPPVLDSTLPTKIEVSYPVP
jgi:hypothetical protein